MNVARPALNYYGSKWRLAPQIINLLPPHDCYVEPFGGSAAVLIQKTPSPLEVYNDMDREVVNFFRVLRSQPDELIRQIKLTAMARAELDLAYEHSDDPLERARRYYVKSWLSRGSNARWRSGWRYEIRNSRGKPFIRNWNETYHLWQIVERLKLVQIECDDALTVIERFDEPTTVFYIDPPYPAATRSASHAVEYRHEMEPDDHVVLAELLHQLSAGVIISSYPNDLYNDLYDDWRSIEFDSRTRSSSLATEILWLSPRLQEMQLPIFNQEATQ